MKTELVAFLVFVGLTLLGIFHHELWLDEMQRWLLVRDSASISELIFNKRYDGHPSLWYILLFGVKQVSHHPLAMQFFHSGIAILSAFLILWYAPFEKWIRILLVFSYFPFFEYNLLNANYALIFLGMLLFCVIYSKKQGPLWLLALLLGLMSNIHILGLVASFALFLYLILDNYQEKKAINLVAFIAIYIALSSVAIAHSIPPAEHQLRINFGDKISQPSNWLKSFMTVERSFFPFPNITQEAFWNTYLIHKLIPKPLRLLLVLSVLGACIFLLKKQKKVLVLFILGLLGNWCFTLFFPLNGTRYYGFFFLFFIVSYWLHKAFSAKKDTPFYTRLFLYSLLTTQVFSSIIFYIWDWQKPFSQAPQMAEYVIQNRPTNSIIAVDDYRVAVPMSGYLQEPVYYLAEDRMGSFCHWISTKRLDTVDEVKAKLLDLQVQNPDKNLLLISNKDNFPKQSNTGAFTIDFLQSYTGSLYPTHDYYLYEVVTK